MKKLLIVVAVIATLLWWQVPNWLDNWNQQRAQEAEQFLQQGESFGQTADQQQCLDTALEGLRGCSGNTCTINQGLFLKACWQQSKPADGFCDGIPLFRNKALEEDKEWARYYCRDKDISHEGCRFLLKRQQYFCSDGVAADANETAEQG